MSFIGELLGAGGQSDWQAQNNGQGVGLIGPSPVGENQINNNAMDVHNSMQQQQNLLMALQQQGGIQKQGDVYNQLQGVANGTGPNPAQDQYRANIQQLAAQQSGMLGSQKGINPALQSRMIAQQQSGAMQNAAAQGAANQSQQQLGAMGALGNMANTMAGNQVGQTNAVAAGTQGEQQNLLGAQTAYNQANAQALSNMNTTNSQMAIQNNKAQQGLFGGLLGGSGALFSDENVKTNVKPADAKIQSFLDNAGAHEYSYKDSVKGKPGASPGRHTGPMAQELERSELGSQMVMDTPQGKMVDFQRGLGTIIAAQASLNKRLEALEGGGKKMAAGGEVTKGYADGGAVAPMAPAPQPFANQFQGAPSGPQSLFGKFINGVGSGMEQGQNNAGGGGMGGDNPMGQGMKDLMKGIGDRIHSQPTEAPDPSMAGADYESAGQMGVQQGSSIDAANMPVDTGEGAAMGAEGAEGASAAEGAAGAAEAGEAGEGVSMADAAVVGLSKGGDVHKLLGALSKNGSNVGSKLKKGGHVPGKAKVKGDSYSNDTVSAKLSPGEVVIPKSVMESKNPVDGAARFVAAVMAKKKAGGK